ncbi:MAG: haloacid dehalogenase-like hydrolase [Proteobacteria bacterium]|nr:haloacid dehalogenase-like hydrolase [Pseudomonadota bacterium]
MHEPEVVAVVPLTRRRWLAAIALSIALAACAPMSGAPPVADPLSSWNEGAAKQRIVAFVKAVSTEGSKDHVAPAERIAVFDNDGALWLEYPMYTQFRFVFDRIKALAPQHPQWQDQEPFRSVLADDMKGVMASGEKGLVELLLAAQSGTDIDQFGRAVNDWLAKTQDPRFKRGYDTLTYQPMLELLRYLRAHGFRTYISSGGSVEFMRPFTERVYGIPPEQVVGTRQKLLYEVKDGKGVLLMQPQIDHVNDGAGKPAGIETLIGRRPIAAFGNSDGDLAMLQYTTTGQGLRLGMIVHHDDAVREYAYDRESHVGRLDKGLDQYRAAGWTLISMKNDWKVVFASVK